MRLAAWLTLFVGIAALAPLVLLGISATQLVGSQTQRHMAELQGRTVDGLALSIDTWLSRSLSVLALQSSAFDPLRLDEQKRLGYLQLVYRQTPAAQIVSLADPAGTLLAEPLAILVGLSIAIVQPGLLSIAFLDGLRKVTHYSLIKPTKEGLFAALPRDVVFIAKPLLDTLIYRTGSLIGAAYFTAALGWGLTPKMRQYMLLCVTVVWAGNSFWLGILAERHQREMEEAESKKTKELV